MKNEELNTKVYEKAFAEQEKFKEWLLSQPPEEILHHAYMSTPCEKIFCSPLNITTLRIVRQGRY